MNVVRAAQCEIDHARANGQMIETVYDNEGARLANFCVGIKGDRFAER